MKSNLNWLPRSTPPGKTAVLLVSATLEQAVRPIVRVDQRIGRTFHNAARLTRLTASVCVCGKFDVSRRRYFIRVWVASQK